mgnify:FL=1
MTILYNWKIFERHYYVITLLTILIVFVPIYDYFRQMINDATVTSLPASTEATLSLTTDPLIPGNIIACTESGLLTANAGEASAIAGGELNGGEIFDEIRGIAPTSATEFIVSDFNNRCLKLVHHCTGTVEEFSGTCEFANRRPVGMQRDINNGDQILFIQDNNVMAVNINDASFTVFAEGNFTTGVLLTGITQKQDGDIHVTDTNSIWRISCGDRQFSPITLQQPQFNYLSDLVFIDDHTLFVADLFDSTLQLVDLSAGSVTSVDACRGAVASICCPTSLLLTDNALYVGYLRDSVQKFTCE